MYLAIHMKCLYVLADSNQILNVWANIAENLNCKIRRQFLAVVEVLYFLLSLLFLSLYTCYVLRKHITLNLQQLIDVFRVVSLYCFFALFSFVLS
jgi:hypothetical protein